MTLDTARSQDILVSICAKTSQHLMMTKRVRANIFFKLIQEMAFIAIRAIRSHADNKKRDYEFGFQTLLGCPQNDLFQNFTKIRPRTPVFVNATFDTGMTLQKILKTAHLIYPEINIFKYPKLFQKVIAWVPSFVYN